MKKVLILGGSYFVGRVFTRMASRMQDYDLHVVNRGNYPLKIENITHYACDRHNVEELGRRLPETIWDAVIDFCAYEPGDIFLSAHAASTNHLLLLRKLRMLLCWRLGETIRAMPMPIKSVFLRRRLRRRADRRIAR